MPMYISLMNWTDQGIRSVKESPSRVRQSAGQFQQLGVQLRDVYLTMGDHDLVAIFEAPDDQTAARAMLSLGMAGNVRTTTLKAFGLDEFEQLAGSLG